MFIIKILRKAYYCILLYNFIRIFFKSAFSFCVKYSQKKCTLKKTNQAKSPLHTDLIGIVQRHVMKWGAPAHTSLL